MARADKPPRRSLTSRFAGWLKSFSGVVASLATIITAVAAIFAAYQTSRVHEQSRVIQHQAQQLRSAKAAAQSPPAAAPTPSVSSGSSGGATSSQDEFLSALQPTTEDPSGARDVSETMSARPYPDSVTFSCFGNSPDVAYDVAGHTVFTALIGMPDNAQSATGLDETVTISSQEGAQLIKPVVVSLGSPARVHINITGVTQLQFSCTGTSMPGHQQDDGNQLTLGNAEIS